MVVRWTPSAESASGSKQNLAVVLCPHTAEEGHVEEGLPGFLGNKAQASQGLQRYLCATVSSGTLADTYEINLWRQVVIHVKEMEAEVLLEYDAATRYYHTTV
jgi:kinesin family protein 2/24